MWFALKTLLTALIIAGVSTLARRSTVAAALLASLPLVSVLGFIWLYLETGDRPRIATLAWEILWLVPPSLLLFVVLALALRGGLGFWISLALGCGASAGGYALVLAALRLRGAA